MTENLTTYTEVDPFGSLTVTSSRVTIAYFGRDSDTYIYKDFGASYFDGFSVQFTIKANSGNDDDSGMYIGFANNVDDFDDWSQYAAVSWYKDLDGDSCMECLNDGGNDISDVLSSNTVYYCTFERLPGGTSTTLKIYSDAARTVLVDTVTAAIDTSRRFRYFYAASDSNWGEDIRFYGYVENFQFLSNVQLSSSSVQVIGLEAW